MQASEFIQQAKNAIDEHQQPTTIFDMEKLYPSHKEDKEFLLKYLLRLTRLRMNTTNLLDDYINMLDNTERSSPVTIQILIDNGTWLNQKLQLGIAMTTLENNPAVFNDLKAKNLVHGETLASIKNNATAVSLEKAIAQKDEVSLGKVIALKDDFSKNTFDNKQTVALRFRYDIHDYEMFKKMNRDFINNYLLSIPLDTFLKRDQVFYQEIKRKIETGNDQKNNTQEYINSYKHTQSIQLCNFLARTAENLLKIPLNKADCKDVMIWAAMATQIASTDTEFYKNVTPYYKIVYAKTLYRNGKRAKALAMIGKLLDANSDNQQAKKTLNELITKMKSDQEI